MEDRIDNERYVILFDAATRTVLDSETLSRSHDVGAAGVFSRQLEGDTLSFSANKGIIRDSETESVWNLLGAATSGRLAGRRLLPMEHGVYFAFAWLAFRPDTEVITDLADLRRN